MKAEKYNISKMLIENRWVWHCCFWIFYVLYVFRNYYVTVLEYRDRLNFMLVADLIFVSCVYITLLLYKQLVKRKKYFMFLFSGTILWLSFVIFRSFLMKEMLHSIPSVASLKIDQVILSSLPAYFLLYILVVGFKYLKDLFFIQYQQNQQQKLQMHFELENLKAQISPHFLFNTMNNFYGLAVENSNKLPDLMIRLSDLLRYSLYETKHEKVSLKDEIHYLKNYIELEKIRLESNLDVEFNVNVTNPVRYQIAPLLFIVFIENAFKHARNIINEPVYVAISIFVSEDGIINLTVKNNFNANAKNDLATEKGIGLENVKKRLSVIYPNENHLLKIDNNERFYNVELTIHLQ